MLVVIVGLTTAAALASVTVKFSGPSTTESCVVAIVKLNSAHPSPGRRRWCSSPSRGSRRPRQCWSFRTQSPAAAVSPPARQRREVGALGRRARRAIKRKRHALAGTKPNTTQAHRVGPGRGTFRNRRPDHPAGSPEVVVRNARRDRWVDHRRRAGQRHREVFRPLDHRILRGGDRKTQQRRTRRQVGGGGVRRRHVDHAARASAGR